MNGWPGEVEHKPTCLDVMTCTCITAAEFNAYDSVCERLAEAVRLLKKVEWDEHAPTEIAAFLAKEKSLDGRAGDPSETPKSSG